MCPQLYITPLLCLPIHTKLYMEITGCHNCIFEKYHEYMSSSTIRMFADDCLVYRTITNTKDHLSLQQDLNTLVKWSDSWQMKFNVAKCSIIHVTQNRSKISHNYMYTMNDEIIQTATTHPYLGVELSSNMKWDSHINIVTRKAHQMLGFRGGSRIFSQGGSGGTQCHKDAAGVSGEGTEGGLENFEYEVL